MKIAMLSRNPGVRLCLRSRSLATTREIALDSDYFDALRRRGNKFVDKTGAIADLLMSSEGMHQQKYAYFVRPRKFGKSLTLSIAGRMLSSGVLPDGVAPWPGYARVDIDALFGGLIVHNRLLRGDPSLRGLLRRVHFVIHLNLGGTQTGAQLEAAISYELAGIAGSAFGPALEAVVRSAPTPESAVRALVRAIPAGVPVVLLVDEYDGAVVQDVSKRRWGAAEAGVAALRSLLMATKTAGDRIERCLVTGVAKFAHTSLFSGANNFLDFTASPLTSAALGFSKEEICATYSEELSRLAKSLNKDVEGALAVLAEWYNGYCFDGTTTSFNPFPVLRALKAGRLTEREMEAASGTNWLGLTPAVVVQRLFDELAQRVSVSTQDAARFSIADLENQSVHVVPLLLQTGLLTLTPGQSTTMRVNRESTFYVLHDT
jgi:hypothetical protein